jgi:hypothetical protein
VDGRTQSARRIVRAATALADQGIPATLYTFPRADRALERLRVTCALARRECFNHVCIDAEPHEGHHWSPGLLADAINIVRDADLGVSVSFFHTDDLEDSYHTDVDLVLQVYQTIAKPTRYRTLSGWYAGRWARVIPAIRAYGTDPGTLSMHRNRAGLDAAIWSVDSLSGEEAAAVRR